MPIKGRIDQGKGLSAMQKLMPSSVMDDIRTRLPSVFRRSIWNKKANPPMASVTISMAKKSVKIIRRMRRRPRAGRSDPAWRQGLQWEEYALKIKA
jgi:hypothetical protein